MSFCVCGIFLCWCWCCRLNTQWLTDWLCMGWVGGWVNVGRCLETARLSLPCTMEFHRPNAPRDTMIRASHTTKTKPLVSSTWNSALVSYTPTDDCCCAIHRASAINYCRMMLRIFLESWLINTLITFYVKKNEGFIHSFLDSDCSWFNLTKNKKHIKARYIRIIF